MDWETTLEKYRPQMLSILRIMIGLLFLCHGLQKPFGFPAAGPPNFQWASILGAAAIIEIVGSILFTAGLFTRAAAFIMSGEMAYAYWIFANRSAQSFYPLANRGELEVLYCFIFLYFVFAGAGAWSLDASMRKRS